MQPNIQKMVFNQTEPHTIAFLCLLYVYIILVFIIDIGLSPHLGNMPGTNIPSGLENML